MGLLYSGSSQWVTKDKPKNRGTLRALGLRKIGDTNVLPDRPEIRGMIARVPHLIEVTEN